MYINSILIFLLILVSCNNSKAKLSISDNNLEKRSDIKVKTKSINKNVKVKTIKPKIKKLMAKDEAIKIAEKLAQKKGYDINYSNERVYIKRYEFKVIKRIMLETFRCYTKRKDNKKWIKYCTDNTIKKREDRFEGNLSEYTWIIYYTPRPKNSKEKSTFIHGSFTVVIGAETGEYYVRGR